MREGVERRERRRGKKRDGRVEAIRAGVLMLFLRDKGEGHINPALTAFLKESFGRLGPSVHLSLRCPSPSTAACLHPGRGHNKQVGGVPVALKQFGQKKIIPLLSTTISTQISISDFFVPLCCGYIPQDYFSSSLLFIAISHWDAPHHPAIISRALSWLSLPKPSGLIVWSRGMELASWNEKWGFLSASIFILFSFSRSFVSRRPPPFPFFPPLSITPQTRTHTSWLALFARVSSPLVALLMLCQSHPTPRLISELPPPVLRCVDWQLNWH